MNMSYVYIYIFHISIFQGAPEVSSCQTYRSNASSRQLPHRNHESNSSKSKGNSQHRTNVKGSKKERTNIQWKPAFNKQADRFPKKRNAMPTYTKKHLGYSAL